MKANMIPSAEITLQMIGTFSVFNETFGTAIPLQ